MWRVLGALYVAAGLWLMFRRDHRHPELRWHAHKCPCGAQWAHKASRDWTVNEAIAHHTCPSCNTEVWEATAIPAGRN